MKSYNYNPGPSAPPMYPDVVANSPPPVPPPRQDLQQTSPDDNLIMRPPPRMDKPLPYSSDHSDTARDGFEKNDGSVDHDTAYQYNRYATLKTIGHGSLVSALLFSNIMQLRTLILQKQHDTIWKSSILLVVVSFLLEIGLSIFLCTLIRGDIRNPREQRQLERCNKVTFVLIVLLSIINIAINVFMLTINPKSFLDTHSLEILHNP